MPGSVADFLWNFKVHLSSPFFSLSNILGLSAGTRKLCIFGHLGLVFIWSCFVSCLLLLLYYVICAPVLTEGTNIFSCERGSWPLHGLMAQSYRNCKQ